jgi:hypothetical protein
VKLVHIGGSAALIIGIGQEAIVRASVLAALVLLASAQLLAGQSWSGSRPMGDRRYTATAGVGNSMGWFGVQGERYLLDERLSIFAGVGWVPSLGRGDRRGPGFAAGVRSFTSGARHRLFVEGSASPVVRTTAGGVGGGPYYGPGLQGGYQFVSPSGFTLMLSIGAGYALGVPRGGDPWARVAGVGLGYTWRRLPDLGGARRM